MRLFLLVRHAESLLNADDRVNADPAQDVDLTERGKEQARRLGTQLAHLPLDVCVHTRFPRTRRTAELALSGRDVPFREEPLLDDIDVGDLDGLTMAQYRAWKRAHAFAEPLPGGESRVDAALRYAEAYDRLADGPEGCVLVVCHEMPIRYALNAAGGSDRPDEPGRDVPNAIPFLFEETTLRAATKALARLA